MTLFPRTILEFESAKSSEELVEDIIDLSSRSSSLYSGATSKPFRGSYEGSVYKFVSTGAGLGAICVCEINPKDKTASFRINKGFIALYIVWFLGVTIGVLYASFNSSDIKVALGLNLLILPISAILFYKFIRVIEKLSREVLINRIEKSIAMRFR